MCKSPVIKSLIQSYVVALVLLISLTAVAAQESIWVTYMSGGMQAMERGNYADAEKLFRAAVTELRESEIRATRTLRE
jgi:hypothetical protein